MNSLSFSRVCQSLAINIFASLAQAVITLLRRVVLASRTVFVHAPSSIEAHLVQGFRSALALSLKKAALIVY